ncbi:hypothetical protein R3W88_014852 [Solanum pinnatisectum]|uniref:Uncharacterized protein n=1 Tax=Solanum pinnatisectum TaxID=50273 RepID=A0AAV9KSV8_9SOLN|nr:hypothetical protein R3W88_014852 [Solanum pinnatisectum]
MCKLVDEQLVEDSKQVCKILVDISQAGSRLINFARKFSSKLWRVKVEGVEGGLEYSSSIHQSKPCFFLYNSFSRLLLVDLVKYLFPLDGPTTL